LSNNIILEIIGNFNNKELRKICAVNMRLKNLCARDRLSRIINENIPEVLLNMDLNTLNNICRTNRRISRLCNNQFWYLKLDRDYGSYIDKFRNLSNVSYYSRLIYDNMLMDSKAYYVVFNDYEKCKNTVDNPNEILYKNKRFNIIDAISFMINRYMSTNIILKLLSLSYVYTSPTLESKLSMHKIPLLSNKAVISSLFPSDFNWGNTFNDGIFIKNNISPVIVNIIRNQYGNDADRIFIQINCVIQVDYSLRVI